MKTLQTLFFKDSKNMKEIQSSSVDLIVTSPPYPMIEMWDDLFSQQNDSIRKAISHHEGTKAFELMHKQLDPVWHEAYRVLKPGGFACINIGDATRTLNGNFVLYPNHMRILKCILEIGFSSLPCILWRKQTNAPNKFMGSGMLPAGAYVTLEHEYVLILRKGPKREFQKDADKKRRQESAIFWEERNIWFSDVWFDIKGATQKLTDRETRHRSAAYPFELAYRLINMYSAKNDTVLDPFLGSGTTMVAAIASGRNCMGYEIDRSMKDTIFSAIDKSVDFSNNHILKRLKNHLTFIKTRIESKIPIKHINSPYNFPVITGQEKAILLNKLVSLEKKQDNSTEVLYDDAPQATMMLSNQEDNLYTELKKMETQQQSIEKATPRNTEKKNLQLSLFGTHPIQKN